MNVLAIDPGNISGWALFKNKTLNSCGIFPVRNFGLNLEFKCDILVIEKPKVYPIKQWKGDPNDLIHVALIAGYFSGKIKYKDLHWVYPQQWKGQTPKEIDHKRTMGILTNDELLIFNSHLKHILKSHRHNMLDAIGIGLWELRRK